MTVKVLVVCLSILILTMIFELVRRERLTFKYAFGWILASILSIFLATFEQFLFKISKWLGFQLTSNFVFFTLLGVFIFLGLVMTIFLCQQDNRNDAMAQKIGILEFELKKMQDQLKSQIKPDDERPR